MMSKKCVFTFCRRERSKVGRLFRGAPIEKSLRNTALDLEAMTTTEKPRRSKRKIRQEKIGLKKEDALNRAKWRDGVQTIVEGNPAISATGTIPDQN